MLKTALNVKDLNSLILKRDCHIGPLKKKKARSSQVW
jgi:hypothetical protein